MGLGHIYRTRSTERDDVWFGNPRRRKTISLFPPTKRISFSLFLQLLAHKMRLGIGRETMEIGLQNILSPSLREHTFALLRSTSTVRVVRDVAVAAQAGHLYIRSNARSRPLPGLAGLTGSTRQCGAKRKLAPIIWWRITLVRSKVLPDLGGKDVRRKGKEVETIHFCQRSVNVPCRPSQTQSTIWISLPLTMWVESAKGCNEMTSQLLDHPASRSKSTVLKLLLEMSAIGTWVVH